MFVSRVPQKAHCFVRENLARLAHGVATWMILSLTSSLQLGCALLLSEPPPANIEPPQKYLSVSAAAQRYRPAPDWWRAFRSVELTTLVERAIEANYDIAAAVARIEQADA